MSNLCGLTKIYLCGQNKFLHSVIIRISKYQVYAKVRNFVTDKILRAYKFHNGKCKKKKNGIQSNKITARKKK